MKIAIDTSPLKSGHQYRGIGVYTQNLVEAFQKEKITDFHLQLVDDKKISDDGDLIHYPFFDLFFLTLPLKKLKQTVVTIHDVIPLVFPENFPAGFKGKIKFNLQKIALKNVKAVITDSENSKKDIFKYLNYPKERIFVVPLAQDKEFKVIKEKNLLDRIQKKYQLSEEFLLYVGDVNYNKNVLGLIKAFAEFKKDHKNFKLVLVGKAFQDKSLKETKEIIQLIDSLKLGREIIKLGWVPVEDLVVIYNLARVYCQPSFYEGFGLPVLEAMACGTPVVASEASSLPEICGEAALMVDPHDIQSLCKGLKSIVDNPSTALMLKQKGLKQSEKFSWSKTALKTYEIYQKVV